MTPRATAFDLTGDLPTGTTVLEASAGTGKTYTIAALVTRYVAEGLFRLEEMLIVTFGRAASQELRDRVRRMLTEAEQALADPDRSRRAGGVIGHLAQATDAEVMQRRHRLQAALADFDAATIATTHQFCHLVLRSLGVAGDTDAHAVLVDDLTGLTAEVIDDLYLARYGDDPDPMLKRSLLAQISRRAISDPQAALAPAEPEPGSAAEQRVRFVGDVRAEVERRKRRRGLLSYDDLLTRLAAALEPETSPARERMRERWRVVLVDEFQDTDPVQWAVLERAFHGAAGITMVLIGDPKQAIYAFRGGDIVTYLTAVETVAANGELLTLNRNWRSEPPLVAAVNNLLGGVALGDPRIIVHEVQAADHEPTRGLRGAPVDAPLRVRMLPGADAGLTGSGTIPIGAARERIAGDLAADVALLLGSEATVDGRPVGPGDVAVLMHSLNQAQLFRDALAQQGIPSVVSGGSSVLTSPAASDWLTLLEAMEQPHRPVRVRAVGLGPFVGLTPVELDTGGDDLTDDLADRVRGWGDLFRTHGIAGVYASITSHGLMERVLARPDGERLLTDVEHLAQLLHDQAHRKHLGIVSLLGWLRSERRGVTRQDTRTRRLDTDAKAVQFTTIHASKGLQYPVVYLPVAFNRWVNDKEPSALYHDGGRRTLDVSTGQVPRARVEAAEEELRLTYVALTRAQSQVVTWVAPTRDSATAGVSRMLLGRAPHQPIPQHYLPGLDDAETWARLTAWQEAGAIRAERVTARTAPALTPAEQPPQLAVRSFERDVDTSWRRTSYSGLIRAEEESHLALVHSEPEIVGTDDEFDAGEDPPAAEVGVATLDRVDADPAPVHLPSPMDALPAGASFGSLVHEVLERADPHAADLHSELRGLVADHVDDWGVPVDVDHLAQALLPMQDTPLGPLADDARLRDIGLQDRLCELDFEFPLAGGDHPAADAVLLGRMADVLHDYLEPHDPMLAYAERLRAPGLGGQVLRGYLSGSIDVVLRVPDPDAGHRFIVVDYKTNRLGRPGEPLTTADYTPRVVTAAMVASHYPLQALLYSVVLHRYLRWRLPGYDPERHLGGILYLYVRGMAGPDTPLLDGQPCGVFAWRPPATMILALSDLLAGDPPTLRTEGRQR